MRIACYNTEWFNRLFDDEGRLLRDEKWSARHNITRKAQADALGAVFAAVDADAIMIIEAPDSHAGRDGMQALENFAAHYGLRTRRALMGFTNTTQQEIALLYDPDKLAAEHAPQGTSHSAVPRFDSQFEIDLDIDARADSVVFSKPPLELEVTTAKGTLFRMIGVHLKSKAPHGAVGRDQIMQVSIANRRKQLAQAVWLRARVSEHLSAGDPVMVLGDLNDGPGLDQYEELFGRSSVEIVLGEGSDASLYDPHAARALERRIGAAPTTSRFFLTHEKRFLQALLDYIMVSADLRHMSPIWRIWHPFDDPECWTDTALRDALITASDHYPVSIDLDI